MPLSAPTKFGTVWNNSGVNRNTIPVASQIGVTPGLASFQDGFPPLTLTPIASGGVPPFGQDFNGIFYAITLALQWLQAGGGYTFDSTFASTVGGYPLGAEVQRSDGMGFWINTSANNSTGPESATSGTNWIPLPSNTTFSTSMASGSVTLTAIQAANPIIILTGLLTASVNLILPTWQQRWLIVNNCTNSGSNAYAVTVKTASGSGALSVPGTSLSVYGDGTNILENDVNAQPLVPSASVTSNALTLSVSPGALSFRNPTLTNGLPVQAQIGAALSITIPSGATLGTVNGQQANLVGLVAYNGGTPVLCVTNLAGGVDLSETGLISPTTISGSSNSAGVIYSASAVSANSPYRVVGLVQISEATAGTWATAPTLVQGQGGQALAALQSFGYGQTLQNMTGSRSLSTTYYNTTAKPILVEIQCQVAAGQSFTLNKNGSGVTGMGNVAASSTGMSVSTVVYPGESYSLTASGSTTITIWSETR